MLDILQSLLAFAITMLALSTLVTVILELFTRFLKRRHRVLKRMLARVFDEEISPLVADRLTRLENDGTRSGTDPVSVARKKFLDDVKQSRFRPEQAEGWLVRASVILSSYLNTTQSNEMSREEFVRRIAVSELGPQIAALGDRADDVIERIGLRYDEMAAGAREYMKNSSAVFSLMIGIGVAIALNVDAHRLLKFYIEHPAVSAEISKDADKFVASFEAGQKKLDATVTNLASQATGQDNLESQTAALQKDVAELKALVAKAPALGGLSARADLPFGTSYFPHCLYTEPVADRESTKSATKDPRCNADTKDASASKDASLAWKGMKFVSGALRGIGGVADLVADIGSFIFSYMFTADGMTWLLKVFVTGVLIGLGGPFWYDAVKGLARAAQVLRGRAGESAAEDAKKSGAPVGDAKEIFQTNVAKPAPPTRPYSGPLWRPAPPETAAQQKDGV